MESGIEQLLVHKSTKSRMDLIDRMETYLVDNLGYITVPDTEKLMELLLRKLMSGNLEKPFAVISGEFTTSVKPSLIKIRDKSYLKYNVTKFDETFYFNVPLGELDESSRPRMDVSISITGYDDILVKGEVLGQEHTRKRRTKRELLEEVFIFEHEKVFDSKELTIEMLSSSIGVGIKQVKQNGCIDIASDHYFIGNNSVGDYVFIFFDHDQLFFFDGDANYIPQTVEGKRRSKLEKISMIHRLYSPLTKVTSDSAERYFLNLWKDHPELFSNAGRKLFVAGQTTENIDLDGAIPFPHYVKGKRVAKLYADDRLYGKEVKVRWGDNNILIEYNGEIINAQQLDSDWLESNGGKKLYDSLGDVLFLKPLTGKRVSQVSINGKVYHLSEGDINSALAKTHENAQKALFVHMRNLSNPDFRLLEYRNGNTNSYPVFCHRIEHRK